MQNERKPFALLINDIHVSNDNIQEFNDNWREALDICHTHEIKRIVIGGDLWQSRSSQTLSTLIAVKNAILKAAQNNINIIIAEGNHDKVNLEDTDGYSSIFSEYPNVRIVDDTLILRTECFDLAIMSYFKENGSFVDRFKELKGDCDAGRTILYLHQGIRGGLSSVSDDELPASLFDGFKATLVGHYHNRKCIPGTTIHYIGSSRQHNFGEDDMKGYTMLYSDGSYAFFQNQVNTRYETVDISFEELGSLEYELKDTLKNPKHKIRVRVSCSSAQANSIDRAKYVEMGVAKIEFITELTNIQLKDEKQDITQKYDKKGLQSEYESFCKERQYDPKLGLEFLNQIN